VPVGGATRMALFKADDNIREDAVCSLLFAHLRSDLAALLSCNERFKNPPHYL